MTDPIAAFREAMQDAGFNPPADIVPGKFHRFSANGKRKDTAGFCKLFDDMRGGIYGDFREGVTHEWQAAKPASLSPAERAAYRQAIEAAKAERERQLTELAAAAAAKAEAIWNEAELANDNHPYLQRKQIKAHIARLSRDALVVPIRDNAGALHSLQFIQPDGSKRFLTGGAIRGHYCGIGKPNGKLFVAEGFATAASIFEATGTACAVAFNAGNLEPVAVNLRTRFPDAEIVICADNDTNTPGNPGITKANRAAAVAQAQVIAPDTGDFNDMALQAGPEAVAQALTLKPANDNAVIDYMSPLPDTSSKGTPLSTIENLTEVIRRLNVTIRYNVISKEEEILIPGASFSVDNRQNASLAWLMSWCARFRMRTDKVGDYVTYLADQNQFNPVANWITSKPWDGVSRLPDLYRTITSTNEPLKETLMRRWMISAVAAAFSPDGVSAHGVLTLQGSQYLGKTKWFKSLVPSHLGVVQDGMLLNPNDRDSVKKAVGFWLVELGELDATFRKSDIAALKSFLTLKNDILRRAYARKESQFARRTVFFGSVNPKQFLHDPTGNRRYWTIEATAIDHSHSLDMQQVWAEVHTIWQGGEGYYLEPDEMDRLNAHNEDFTVADPVIERLQSRLDWDAHQAMWRWRSATDVLIEVGMDRPTQSDVTKAATIIRQMNGNKAQRSTQGRQLLVPPIRPIS
jgi:putative DNA primase/helicase